MYFRIRHIANIIYYKQFQGRGSFNLLIPSLFETVRETYCQSSGLENMGWMQWGRGLETHCYDLRLLLTFLSSNNIFYSFQFCFRFYFLPKIHFKSNYNNI